MFIEKYYLGMQEWILHIQKAFLINMKKKGKVSQSSLSSEAYGDMYAQLYCIIHYTARKDTLKVKML